MLVLTPASGDWLMGCGKTMVNRSGQNSSCCGKTLNQGMEEKCMKSLGLSCPRASHSSPGFYCFLCSLCPTLLTQSSDCSTGYGLIPLPSSPVQRCLIKLAWRRQAWLPQKPDSGKTISA